MLSSLYPGRKSYNTTPTILFFKSRVTVGIIMLALAVIILEKDLWWAAASVTSGICVEEWSCWVREKGVLSLRKWCPAGLGGWTSFIPAWS